MRQKVAPGCHAGAGCQTALPKERYPKPRPAAGAYMRPGPAEE